MTKSLKEQATQAAKWSAITEIMAKLVMPISNIILARLLTPEAFGVVASLMMVISFVEIFTDAGFQKYLIQHEFHDDVDKEQSTNVAFWSNFLFSIFLWICIAIFAKRIASLVGNPDMWFVLIVSCVCIPLAAFSSIQMALFKRDFDFKTLFRVRIVSVVIPLIVTVPLAFWLRTYWALVIGIIAQNLANAVLLMLYSSWKPRFFYSLQKFREMFSFTMWTMFESVSLWLTSYVDIFIVGRYLNQYYLGLYTTSTAVVGQIIGIVQATSISVIFPTLSRLQSDDEMFKETFYKIIKIISVFLVPMGAGIFCFRHLVTAILLGDQWYEAEGFIGLWGLMSTITILFAQYASEVYRSKGRPKLSVLAQWLHIVVLWPVVLIAVYYGFKTLYVARSLVRIESIIVNIAIMYAYFKISAAKMMKNVIPSFIAATIMILISFLVINVFNNMLWQIACVILCGTTYLIVLYLFPEERSIIKNYCKKIYLKLKAF